MKIGTRKGNYSGSLRQQYQQERNETAGRCRSCGTVYVWQTKLGRLREAVCPRCGRRLSQTTLANFKVGRVRVVTDTPPRFEPRRSYSYAPALPPGPIGPREALLLSSEETLQARTREQAIAEAPKGAEILEYEYTAGGWMLTASYQGGAWK